MRQYLNRYLENDEKTKIKLTDLYTHYCKSVDDPLSYEKFCDFIRPIYTLKRFTDGNYIIGMKLKQIKQKPKSSDQSFILHITDTHFGKKTLSYNYNKACGYMDSLAKRLDIIAKEMIYTINVMNFILWPLVILSTVLGYFLAKRII